MREGNRHRQSEDALRELLDQLDVEQNKKVGHAVRGCVASGKGNF